MTCSNVFIDSRINYVLRAPDISSIIISNMDFNKDRANYARAFNIKKWIPRCDPRLLLVQHIFPYCHPELGSIKIINTYEYLDNLKKCQRTAEFGYWMQQSFSKHAEYNNILIKLQNMLAEGVNPYVKHIYLRSVFLDNATYRCSRDSVLELYFTLLPENIRLSTLFKNEIAEYLKSSNKTRDLITLKKLIEFL